jgi:hypothetical protein
VNNRKSKLIFFYDWLIEGEWEGVEKQNDSSTPIQYQGKFEVLNFSEENEINQVDVTIYNFLYNTILNKLINKYVLYKKGCVYSKRLQ